MNNFLTLLRREVMEMFREYKIIWLPIAFIGLCIIQPITMKMLPDILSDMNGISVDANAIVTGNEVFSGVYTQLNELGLVVLGIAFMGAVCNEKKQKILSSIFSKPVSVHSYLISKYLANYIITFLSLSIGTAFGLFYTNHYFSDVDLNLFLKSFGFYSLWLLFIISTIITASVVGKSQIQAGIVGICIPAVMQIITAFQNKVLKLILPVTLSDNSIAIMNDGLLSKHWVINIFITVGWIIMMYLVSYIFLKRKNFEC